MKRLRDTTGLVLGAILIVMFAGGVLFTAVVKVGENWEAAKPPVKVHHYKLVKDPTSVWHHEYYHKDQIVVDIPVPMPDTTP